MKVILRNRHFKGITVLLLFITGSISLMAAIPAAYQQQFGLSAGGSILADIFNLKPASVVVSPADEAATVRTSKSNYVPGETAKITGEGFGANETVTLQVLHTDGTPNTGAGHAPWTVTSDGDGVFTSTWYVEADDSANSSFQLTAISQTASASANFTDAANAAADLDQCRNGRIINPKDCVGDGSGVSGWVNGNVGQSDGHYIEGYSIPYRMRLSDIGAGDWTLDVGYDTVHSSKHAIDFLTHYDLIGGANLTPTVPPHPLVFNHTAECIDPSDSWIGLPANANNCAGVASTSTFAIPKPIIPNSLGPNPPGDFPCDSPYPGGTVLAGAISCPGSTFDAISGAGEAYMTMWNGNITSIQYVSGEQNVVSGSGQQHTMMRIYFHVSAAQAAADGGNVDLGWGGHIGRTQDWGTNNSAGGISGSPYHMNLHGLCAGSTPNDGTLCTDGGSQDRSLSAAAVFLTGTIRIIKNMQAGSEDGTFHYTTTGANLSPSFDLTTVGGTADTIITGLQPGAKTVTETGPASPFLFVSLTCVDPDNGTTVNGQTANIDLDGGETVTCTYTNREDFNATHGRIIVVKEIPGTGDLTQFTFTPGPGFPNPGSTFTAPFQLGDGGSKDSCVGDNCLQPGTYSVAETANTEYTTTATCLSSVAGKAPDDPSAIHLEEGETKTCTFTNTPKAPSLSIQKTADAASVSAGDAIGFTVTVTNSNAAGTGTAKGVTLSDALPAGTGVDWSIASQSGGASCVINGAPPTETLACGPIDLAPGASFSVHVTSNTTEASCKAYPNTATAQATNNAQVTANASETVLCPNLSINKTADAASVSAGDTIGFTVTVTNSAAAGTGTAKGVTLSDALPAGTGVDWTIQSQSGGASCVINGAPPTETLACGPIDLAPGASFSVHVTSSTTEASCQAYPNTATADATNAPAIQSTASETVLCPNLSINKTADAASVSAGSPIGFTVTVTNSAAAGTGTAKGVTLSDALPAGSGVDWSIASQTGGASCVINGAPPTETLACGPIDLAPGASFSVHVTSATTEASCQAYPNTATADATNAPAVQSTATETVLCPNLSVNKTADAVLVDAGSSIGFTITVSNSGAAGTGTALGVTLSDALPAGSGVDWSIASQSGGASCVINGAPPTETLACGPIDLAPGASFSVHVTSATTAASCKAYPNTATADATNSAPVQSTATETVRCSDVSVTKLADAASVDAPGSVGFTITVSSNGPAPAQNVNLIDTLPTNGGLSWSIDGGTGAGSCSISSGTLTCAFGTMVAGTTKTVHITSSTTAATCGTVNNAVAVTADFEPDTGNNTASASEAVLCGTIVIIKNAKPQTGTFSFTGTGPGYNSFNLSGDPTGGGNVNTQTPLVAGTYTATEATQLGWILTGIGGDPNSPFSCVVTGGHGSTGTGDLSTQAVTINLKGGDTVTCTFENTGSGVTRTQGFWATHTPLANIAWFGGTAFGHTFPGVPNTTIGDPLAPCRTISDLPTLMGGFWSSISKTTTNKKRSPLDQARMQLLQQLLAAELNFSAFGTAPAGGFATIQSWENAYCGTNQNAINAAQQAAGSFNSQGDSSTFTPGTSADSKNARAIANYVTWDVLP